MPLVNLSKKEEIKENITAIVESRFGGVEFLGERFNKENDWDYILSDEDGNYNHMCVCSERMKSLFSYMKLSNCWWDSYLTKKSLVSSGNMVRRMWSYIMSSGNMTQSLYKDKQVDGIKSGKYALVKDMLVLWKTLRDVGNKARNQGLEIEKFLEVNENQANEIEKLDTEIILLKSRIEYVEKTYEKKTGGKVPDPPIPLCCDVCANDMIDEKQHKNLLCCNNKLCLKCIQKIIHTDRGKCPFCRQDMLGKILDTLSYSTADGDPGTSNI